MRAADIVPGLLLPVALALLGQTLAHWLGITVLGLPRSPISGITLAILLGLVLANLVALPERLRSGSRFALTTVLRLGIVLLGLRLSLAEAGEIGLRALPVIFAAIVTALLLVRWLSRRFELPPRLGALIGVGTSICGATAIVATAPTIGAREEETSYAVACIALFGLIAMLLYPFAAHWLFQGEALRAGLFFGTAVHDTAQVVGAGMAYREYFGDARALEVATVTKMVRNLAMILVIPLMAIAYRPATVAPGAQAGTAPRWYQFVPLFVIGFALMSLLRTLGDLGDRPFGLLSAEHWRAAIGVMGTVADYLLATAMAAVGLSTRLATLRAIGPRPLLVALFCALAVGTVSATAIELLY
ncbi:MAG: putative sulfate exporter family transporter [Steroidobacteraceae bacterium]